MFPINPAPKTSIKHTGYSYIPSHGLSRGTVQYVFVEASKEDTKLYYLGMVQFNNYVEAYKKN